MPIQTLPTLDSRTRRIQEIEVRLSELDAERKRLALELTTLQASARTAEELPALLGLPTVPSAPQTSEEKVNLFLSLFRARESVFPKRWENKAGKAGYSPACNNEWVPGICGKPPKGNVKCMECPNQAFPKLDEQAVRDHLQGKSTIGTYAIRADDTCTFLAADFDGDGWRSDVLAYKTAARELGIQAKVERSRSGNGAHAWIFFQEFT